MKNQIWLFALFLSSGVMAQLPPTDSPLGIIDDGTSPTIPAGYVRVAAREALMQFAQTTNSLTTATRTAILFDESSGTTSTTQTVRLVWRRARWLNHFVYRIRDGYWREPSTSRFYYKGN